MPMLYDKLTAEMYDVNLRVKETKYKSIEVNEEKKNVSELKRG